MRVLLKGPNPESKGLKSETMFYGRFEGWPVGPSPLRSGPLGSLSALPVYPVQQAAPDRTLSCAGLWQRLGGPLRVFVLQVWNGGVVNVDSGGCQGRKETCAAREPSRGACFSEGGGWRQRRPSSSSVGSSPGPSIRWCPHSKSQSMNNSCGRECPQVAPRDPLSLCAGLCLLGGAFTSLPQSLAGPSYFNQ